MSRTPIELPTERRSPADLAALFDKSLTEAQKLYMTLYYRDNMSMNEIAARLNVAPSTVSRTIARARKRLTRTADLCRLIRP